MADVNSVVISGNLVKDPETRVLPSGRPVSKFAVANHRGFGDKERSNFVDIEVFGPTADFVNNHVKKGSHVVVVGELAQDKWQDKDGNNRSTIKIIGNHVEFGRSSGKKTDNGSNTNEPDSDEDIPI